MKFLPIIVGISIAVVVVLLMASSFNIIDIRF